MHGRAAEGLGNLRFGVCRRQVEVNRERSGSANTTTARRISCNFTEADGLHANQNVAMMETGRRWSVQSRPTRR